MRLKFMLTLGVWDMNVSIGRRNFSSRDECDSKFVMTNERLEDTQFDVIR